MTLTQQPLPFDAVEPSVVRPQRSFEDEVRDLVQNTTTRGGYVIREEKSTEKEEISSTWPPIRLGKGRPQPRSLEVFDW